MQEVRRFLNCLINLLLVNSQFYAISNPLKGIISPFPHGTCALSIKKSYLRLRGWSPMFRQMFHRPTDLESQKGVLLHGYRAFTFFGNPFWGFHVFV